MNESLSNRIETAGIIAVVSLESLDDAIPTAEALMSGGVRAIELTLRSPVALDALSLLCQKIPDMLVGAGTVLTAEQVERVHDIGAAFAVAPGVNANVIKTARRLDLPFAPGVCTPTDIESAVELGCHVLKFFPAESIGGLSYLRSAAAPYAHLGLRFIPLGGLNAENASNYLDDPLILALGGSWIAPADSISRADWDGISHRARQAMAIVHAARQSRADQ